MGLLTWWGRFNEKQPQKVAEMVELDDQELARNLARRQATADAQKGDYAAALGQLDRVRELECGEGAEADCTSEIRRAKYLQRAGRGDEAWLLFQRLLRRHRDNGWLAIDLLDAMRLHLQREGKAVVAVHYGVAFRLARIKLYRDWKQQAHQALRMPKEREDGDSLTKLMRENEESNLANCETWLSELTDPTDLLKMATALCKKAAYSDQIEKLVQKLQADIAAQTDPFTYLAAQGLD